MLSLSEALEEMNDILQILLIKICIGSHKNNLNVRKFCFAEMGSCASTISFGGPWFCSIS